MELRNPAMPDEPATPRPSSATDPSGEQSGRSTARPKIRASLAADPSPASLAADPSLGSPGGGTGQPPASARWRVDGRLTGMRIGGTVIFAVAAVVLRDDRLGLSLTVLAAVGLLAYAVRDVLAPVRLAADAEGVTVVSGYAGHRRLRWEEIERVRVDRRRRFGTVTELLEIDAGETLHLFSTYDVGVPPHEAEQVLLSIRAAARS